MICFETCVTIREPVVGLKKSKIFIPNCLCFKNMVFQFCILFGDLDTCRHIVFEIIAIIIYCFSFPIIPTVETCY